MTCLHRRSVWQIGQRGIRLFAVRPSLWCLCRREHSWNTGLLARIFEIWITKSWRDYSGGVNVGAHINSVINEALHVNMNTPQHLTSLISMKIGMSIRVGMNINIRVSFWQEVSCALSMSIYWKISWSSLVFDFTPFLVLAKRRFNFLRTFFWTSSSGTRWGKALCSRWNLLCPGLHTAAKMLSPSQSTIHRSKRQESEE